MRYIRFIFLMLLTACHQPTKKADKAKVSQNMQPADLLKAGSINKLVAKNHKRLVSVHGDFNSFKKYLAQLSDNDPASIPYALDYIKTCIPVSLPEKDSVIWLFTLKFYKITNKLSDSLETTDASVIKLMDDKPTPSPVKYFTNNLAACGIGIFQTEGNYYLDMMSGYLYKNFENRISEGVKAYLYIRKGEMAAGFTEDAGLLISFDALYGRVRQWEKFLNDYPKTIYSGAASDYYYTYLQTLLTGMDNSRVFDMETGVLSPEVKTIYEKAMRQDTSSKTSKIISSYYDLLARHNFKETDSVNVFFKEHKLSTMLAVQPDNR
jgi:hypothetical protein